MKRLSVIIPGYNTPEAWWERCLRSVLAACGPEDEIICVDDGSAEMPLGGLGDAPISVPLHLYTADHPPVRWLHLDKNMGPAVARNEALKIATGEYVAFADSDDEMLGNVLSRSVDELERTSADVAMFGAQVVWPADGLTKDDIPERRDASELTPLTPADVKHICRQCLFNYVWNKVYRREFLMRNGIFFDPETVTGEDLLFNLRCVLGGAKWIAIPEVGYCYYRTRGTLLSKYIPSLREGYAQIEKGWQEYVATFPEAEKELNGMILPTEDNLLAMEWKNLWMPGSPYGLMARGRWLKAHPMLGGVKTYMKMLVFMFFRRYFYIKPVRRWNTRRNYPHVTEWVGEKKVKVDSCEK